LGGDNLNRPRKNMKGIDTTVDMYTQIQCPCCGESATLGFSVKNNSPYGILIKPLNENHICFNCKHTFEPVVQVTYGAKTINSKGDK
jgi:hypothetical protein